MGPFGPIRFCHGWQESLGEPLSCFQVSVPSGTDLVIKPSGAGYSHALLSSDLCLLYAFPNDRQAINPCDSSAFRHLSSLAQIQMD